MRRVRRGSIPSAIANVWWRCVQYFVIDNRCVYMAHVCFYDWCSDCVGVCGNVVV